MTGLPLPQKRTPHAALAAVFFCCACIIASCAEQASDDAAQHPPPTSNVDDHAAPNQSEDSDIAGTATTLKITSSAFGAKQAIPRQYTCQGKDTSPPLQWEKGPQGTESYALIMDDPDAPAGTWVHWIAWNIEDTELVANQSKQALVEMKIGGMAQGQNSWNKTGYGGPCPPLGKPHRYFFHLYALDTTLDLDGTASRDDLERAMEGHILAEGELMGTCERSE